MFILTLTSKSPSNTLSPTTSPSAPVSSPPSKDGFETEIEYTRSPHDLAAVLRWALRHLQLEGDSFGIKGVDENAANAIWHWYTQFSTSERTSSYPANAFSLALIPTLPPAHLQLLTATLDIISSLAAHAEANGSSGSKLTKFLGYWVLIGGKRTDEEDDWEKFYERWEAAGRVLEHVFLAYVRYVKMFLTVIYVSRKTDC